MYVNLTVRNDTGRLNTSPVTTMTPIVRLKWGCNHTINIPGTCTCEAGLLNSWFKFFLNVHFATVKPSCKRLRATLCMIAFLPLKKVISALQITIEDQYGSRDVADTPVSYSSRCIAFRQPLSVHYVAIHTLTLVLTMRTQKFDELVFKFRRISH